MNDIKDAFISYGRKESLHFARRLYQQLSTAGFDAWFDFINIPKGDDYQRRIDNGIELAHNFIFIISPHSVESPYCYREIEHALQHGKRIIPILHVEADTSKMPPVIQKTNWIYAREKYEPDKPLEAWQAIDDLDTAIRELIAVFQTEEDYVHRHTQLLYKALEWEHNQKDEAYLLTGDDLLAAEQWLKREFKPPAQPPCHPTHRHAEFICESKKYAENWMTHVFMAYARVDAPIMERFNRFLLRRGITTWIDTKDIRKDIKFEDALEEGIQEADNVIFYISPASCKSPFLLFELQTALKYNKRILPVLIEPVDYQEMPPEIRELTYTDFTALNDVQYEKNLDQIYGKIEDEWESTHTHKMLLVQALKWDKNHRKEADLLSGEALDAAVQWLEAEAQSQGVSQPTELHHTFIRESLKQRYQSQLATDWHDIKDVFISYSPQDSLERVWTLFMGLADQGLNVWFDPHQAPLETDVQKSHEEGIIKSDNIVFVISPGSVRSMNTLKELLWARHLNKRVIPVLHQMPSEADWDVMAQNTVTLRSENEQYQLPENETLTDEIRQQKWLYFREQEDDIQRSLQELVARIQKHADYVRQHTQILIKALDWEHHQRRNSYLPVGEERLQAEAWLKIHFEREQPPCEPTDLHCEYITEGHKNAYGLVTDVFICYAPPDLAIMNQIKRTLMRHSFTVWTNPTRGDTGIESQDEIHKAIEETTTVVFLQSPESLATETCQHELQYAAQLNKRIISLRLEPTSTGEFPVERARVQFLDLIDTEKQSAGSVYLKATAQLIEKLHHEQTYYDQHKLLLVKALRWQRQHNNTTVLLRGHALQKAESWLETARTHKHHPALPVHEAFIQESASQPVDISLDVFISYSRADADFARLLNEMLQEQGKTTWFDQESIDTGVDFQQEIYHGIENSDNFLFIISPAAIESPYCTAEVEYAQRLNKRIVPVLYHTVEDEDSIPAGLRTIQWIDFEHRRSEFQTTFGQLIRTLDTDREHVKNHTKWAQRATEWDKQNRSHDLLLRGHELSVAEAWLYDADEGQKKPAPTALQRAWIGASRQAIRAAELAVERRRRITLTAITLGLLIALFLATVALLQRMEAERQREIAIQNEQEALHQRQIAFENEQEALHQREIALRNEQEAIHQKERALQNEQEAIRQREIALQNAQEALRQKSIADSQRVIAERKEQEALAQKAIADSQRVIALQNEQEANRQRIIAMARQLVAESAKALSNSRPQRSLLLAAEAINATQREGLPTVPAAENALRNGLLNAGGIGLGGHTQPVTAVATLFDATQRLVATASRDGSVQLWSLDENGIPLREPVQFTGHVTAVQAVQFLPDRNQMITAGADGTLRIWSLEGNTPPQIIYAHDKPINTLVLSPDGTHIATASEDGTAKIWDMTAGTNTVPLVLTGHSGGVTDVAFSPDGKWVATAGKDNTARLWDLKSPRKPSVPLTGHTGQVYDVTFSPNSRWLVTSSRDNTLRLWRLKHPVVTLRTVLTGHTGLIYQAAFSADGRYLASASADHTARLWFLPDLREMPHILKGHTGPVLSVAFTPDNHYLITGSWDHTARLWDLTRDNPALNPTILKSHEAGVKQLQISHDGRWLITGSDDGSARLWNLNPPDPTAVSVVLSSHKKSINGVAMSTDNRWLVSASRDSSVQLWNIQEDRPHPVILGKHGDVVNDAAISPDGKWVASGGADGLLYRWDTTSLTSSAEPQRLGEHDGAVLHLTFTPDSRHVFSIGQDGTLRRWNVETGASDILYTHTTPPTQIALSSGGKWLATGTTDGHVLLWKLPQRGEPQHLSAHQGAILSMAFSQDETWLLTGSEDNTAHLWDLSRTPAKEKMILNGHGEDKWGFSGITAVAISPDNRWIATGGKDNTVRLWDLASEAPVHNPVVLPGHQSPISTIIISPDNHWLITGSWDKTARLWDLTSQNPSEEPILLEGHTDAIATMTISSDGQWLVTGSWDGAIRLWALTSKELIDLACRTAGRNLTPAEWERYFGNRPYCKVCPTLPAKVDNHCD